MRCASRTGNVAYTDLVTGMLPERDRGVAGSLALNEYPVGGSTTIVEKWRQLPDG